MRVLSSVLACVLAFALVGCDDGHVWGEPKELLAQRLSSGDYEFLLHIDYDAVRIADVQGLGPHAAYYLSRVFASLGLQDIARELAEHELTHGESIWARRAGEWLVSEHLAAGRFEQAHQVARLLVRRFPEAPFVTRLYADSLYRLERFDTLLSVIGERYSTDGEADDYQDLSAPDEVMIWWIVARIRLDVPNWEDDLVRFFMERESSEAHARLDLYVSYRPEVASEIEVRHRKLMLAKRLLAEGDFTAAYEGLREHLYGDSVPTVAVARDVSRAALGSGNLVDGAQLLTDVATRIGIGPLREALLFEAGRLYRWAGVYTEASATFRMVLSRDEDRPLWYYLDSLIESDLSAATTEFAIAARRFVDPRYFADAFEELVARLAEAGRWDDLWLLYQSVEDFVTPGMASRVQVLLARLIETNVLEIASERRQGLVEQLLRSAADQTEDRFYGMVAQVAMGTEPAIIAERRDEGSESDAGGGDAGATDAAGGNARDSRSSGSTASDGVDSDGRRSAGSTSARRDLGEFVLGHFDFGLAGEAYLEARRQDLETDTLVTVGDLLHDLGMVTDALRLHVPAFSDPAVLPDRDAARRLYPLGYQTTIRRAAETYGIPPQVLFALIREESYFDPSAVSHAGAVGLAQMMPETAADVARRLRLDEPPELTDAVTSVGLGAHYLSYLSERFSPISRALAAYNGGQGRVRRWEQDRGFLDSLVFLETIPLAETRAYVRKVLVSAVYYGYLYEQTSPTTTIRGFFPEL